MPKLSVDLSAQSMVHAMEQGWLAPYIKAAALTLIVIALSVVYIFIQFRGFNQPAAMDQGQIARSVAAGEGFSTKYIRPIALWQLERNNKELPEGNFPDFFYQPLFPLLNAPLLWLAKDSWKMSPLDMVYTGDRLIAALSCLCFLFSAGLWFWLFRKIFDDRLAAFALAAVLLTDLFWKFSISGLSQMLVLLFFSAACCFTWLAIGDGVASARKAWKFLLPAAACFGLMTLTHGLSLWIFAGWFVFVCIFFRQKLLPVFVSGVVFCVVLSPWLVRNYQVSGNPLGLAAYTALWSSKNLEETMFRESSPQMINQFRGFRGRLKEGVISQAGRMFEYLGMNIVAAVFFLSLLHRFKSASAGIFRWGVLVMWLGAFAGMAVYGLGGGTVSPNQLHILFVPLFILFGGAFLMVLWNRLGFEGMLLQKVFSGFLLFLIAIPMLGTIFLSQPQRVQWPPYIPPFIAVLGDWFEKDEILSSDMPWAVAWYANRKTLLIPDSPRTLTRISDYQVLGGPVVGLYLTPLTGNQPLVSSIYRGTYREWARLIIRPPEIQGFFLKAFTPLPFDGECIIFADRERWIKR